MPRINSPAELAALRKDVLSSRDPNRPCIAVCTGSGCLALGAAKLVAALKEEIRSQGLESRIEAREIVASVLDRTVVERLLYVDPETGERVVHEMEIPFYKNQLRLLIGNN